MIPVATFETPRDGRSSHCLPTALEAFAKAADGETQDGEIWGDRECAASMFGRIGTIKFF